MDSDLINLDSLISLYGDDTARELLEMSLKEGRGLIEALKKSVPAHNSVAVGADSHQLKGMSATMTMKRVADLSYKLELAAKAETWTECETLLATIEECFSQLEQLMNKDPA